MARVLSCRDVGVECDFVACGGTDEEVMQKAAVHARDVHNMTEIDPETERKVRAAIHDEKVECR